MVERIMTPNPEFLLNLFNYIGIFVFAISGAVAGIKKRADLFGVTVLAFTAACFGGILRDLLLGVAPPENIRSWEPLAVSFAAGIITFYFFPLLATRLNNPVQVFDAFGLGLFTVLGADKALIFGITPIWAMLLGVITGVGGGMVRDVLLARVPTILRTEIYATASFAGAVIVVAGRLWPIAPPAYSMILGAVVCISLRCLALRYKWQIPVAARGKG